MSMRKKLWRTFSGKKYQLWYKTTNKKAKDLYVESLRLQGFFVRVVPSSDGYQIYKRKKDSSIRKTQDEPKPRGSVLSPKKGPIQRERSSFAPSGKTTNKHHRKEGVKK